LVAVLFITSLTKKVHPVFLFFHRKIKPLLEAVRTLVKTEYIHMWITFYQKIIREKAPESAQKNINLKILSELRIPIPPIASQEKFIICFKHIESLKKKYRTNNELSLNCFNSLTQRAFQGEL